MAQIAVAWSLAKEGVSAPIVGTTSLKNLQELIGTGLRSMICVQGLILLQRLWTSS